MNAASDLTQASWQKFSRLLDEALDLPITERLSWLEKLGVEHASLKPALRSVLARHPDAATSQWLNTLPHVERPPIDDDPDLKANTLVGPYRLLRELGVGGMGAVWLAERADGSLKRQVALKLPRASWSRGLAERMARERDILASLEHPNIARLYDAGTDAQGRPFLALEYVEGLPIDVYCRERSLGIRDRLQLLLQVAQAVAFAHTRLVVHRDLKPNNVLVTADGQVRLLDFGIAKLMEGDRTQETQLTQMSGRALTLDYASPEQIRGEPIGTASDVYSLGVVAYELLTGARPYKLKRGSAAELEEAIATVDAPLASNSVDTAARRELRGDLDAILNKTLKKNPADRYATVDALAQDCRQYLAGHRVLARPDTLVYRAARLTRRHRAPLIVGGVVAVSFALALGVGATAVVMAALAAGAGAALWQARSAVRERDRALRSLQRQEAVQNFMDTVLREAARGGEAFTGRQLFQRCEELADREFGSSGDVPAMVLMFIGSTMHALGEVTEAVRLHERALAASRDGDDPVLRDTLLANWAMSIAWTGRVDEARSTLAAVLKRDIVTIERRGEVHTCMAALAESQNDAPVALYHAERSLQDHRRCGRQDRHSEAARLASLGGACSLNGRMVEAERHFEAAYALFKAIGREGLAQGLNVLNNWSVVNERAGDARRALALVDSALTSATPDAPRSPFIVSNRARALEQLGRWAEAEAGYAEALQLAERLKAPTVIQFAQAGLAWLAMERGEVQQAREWYRRGEAAPPPPTSKAGLLRTLVRARLEMHDGDLLGAVSSLTTLIGERPTLPSTVNALLLRAMARQRAGDWDAARADARAGLEMARRLQGDKPTSVRTGLAYLAIAQLSAEAGKLDDARREAAMALRQLQEAVDSDHPALEQARALAN